MKLDSIPHDIARGSYLAALTMAASVYRDRAVPLPLLRFSRSLALYDNALIPRKSVPVLDPHGIDDPDLAWLFEGQAFDEWSLNHQAINYLHRLYLDLQPDHILEFGSGVSTAVFAHLLHTNAAAGSKRLVSVEQSREFAVKTQALLERAGLRNEVQFEYRSVGDADFGGDVVSCYDLSDGFLDRVFAAIQPALIFIDGPFGLGPVRGPILPRLLPHLRKTTTVILDDALRDNELKILQAWSDLPGVTVKGIHLIRKGMAEIVVTPRA